MIKGGMQEVSGGMWLQFAIAHLSQDRFWEKSTFGSISYIDIQKVIVQNQTFKIGLGQTAPPKMTAMSIG